MPRHFLRFLLFVSLSLLQTFQDLTLVASYSPNSNYSFYSTQATSNHVISIVGLPNADILLVYYHPVLNSLEAINITVTGQVLDPTARIRTAEFNDYANITGFGLLYFNSSSIRYFPYFAAMNIQIYTTPSPAILIREVCLGVFKSIIYVLVEDTVGNSYWIYFYDTTIKISEALLSVSASGNSVHSLKFNNNILMLTLSSRLILYSCVGFVFGPILVDIQYTNTSLSYIDAKIYGQFLIYSTGYSLYIYNLTSSTYIRNYTCPHQIESIAKVSSCIIITCAVAIYQYDYEIDQVISTFVISRPYTTFLKGEFFEGNRLVVYEDYLNLGSKFQLFNITFQYFFNPPLPNITSTNTTQNPTTEPLHQMQPSQKQTAYNQFANTSLSFLATQTASYIFSLSALKTMPKFLLVLSLLVNDLVYYRFHRKFKPEYPNSTLIFMEKFDMMKEVGSSSIQKYTAFLDNTRNTFSANNKHMLKVLEFTDHDPQQVYFLHSASDLQSSIIMSIGSYVLIKLVHFLLYMIKNKHQMLGKCCQFLREGSQWWMLIVSIIEGNMNDLVLGTSLQLLDMSSKSFLDKINILAMLVMFLIVIVYSLGFYCLIYKTQRKKCAKNLIVYLDPQLVISYFFEPALILIRSIMKSFAHGYFISSYPTQIICLFVIDIIFLILCLSSYRKFKKKPVAILVFSYFLGFTLFDFYFVLEINTNITKSWNRELIGFIFCCSLAGISLLLSIILMISSFLDIFKLIKKIFTQKNSVQDNKQENIEKINVGKLQAFIKRNRIQDSKCTTNNNNLVENSQNARKFLKTWDNSRSQQKIEKKHNGLKFKKTHIQKPVNFGLVMRKNSNDATKTVQDFDKIQLKKNENYKKSCKALLRT